MQKIVKVIVALLLIKSAVSTAQVKYQLSLLPDKKTYMVSMVPLKTWNYPQNLTSTAQVTIKVPSDKPFTAAVTNMNPEVKWLDNSYVEHPNSDPSHTYISFGLESKGTSRLKYVENEEIPLFTFRNIESNECVGKVSLLDNVKDALKGKEAETYNISNQISVLATQGDVYVGNFLSEADCSVVTSNKDLFGDVHIKAYPVPADNQLTISWEKVPLSSDKALLIIENALGQEVYRQDVLNDNTTHQEVLNVSTYGAGYYHFYLLSGTQSTKKYKFLIVK
jgi:hypothetical protein